MKQNWEIVEQFILQHEDEFMQYLESEHDVEGSDMDFVLKSIRPTGGDRNNEK